MLRLAQSLHVPGSDAGGRKRLLVGGICRLVGADRGVAVVARLDEATGRRTVVSVSQAKAGTGDAAADAPPRVADVELSAAVADASSALGNAADARTLLREAGVDVCIDSFVSLRGVEVVAWLAVGRRPGDDRRFTARDRLVLDLMHAESAWVYAADVLLAGSPARGLTPRQQEILRHLLTGDGEKQVAAKLGLSPNTVHHHVKAVYRHFGASTRAELLARWVRGGWHGGADGT